MAALHPPALPKILPAGDTYDVIRHSGQEVAVMVPIEEYQQLRQAMQEQRVNEELDAARAGYLARREARAIRYVSHEKRPPGHAVPVSYQVNGEIQAPDQTAGFLHDDPVGVAALWDTVGQLAGEPRRWSRSRTGHRTCGACGPGAGCACCACCNEPPA